MPSARHRKKTRERTRTLVSKKKRRKGGSKNRSRREDPKERPGTRKGREEAKNPKENIRARGGRERRDTRARREDREDREDREGYERTQAPKALFKSRREEITRDRGVFEAVRNVRTGKTDFLSHLSTANSSSHGSAQDTRETPTCASAQFDFVYPESPAAPSSRLSRSESSESKRMPRESRRSSNGGGAARKSSLTRETEDIRIVVFSNSIRDLYQTILLDPWDPTQILESNKLNSDSYVNGFLLFFKTTMQKTQTISFFLL